MTLVSNTPVAQERWNPYVEDVSFKVCPACKGTCFEDEYETAECDRCAGEGIIYLFDVELY